MRRRVGLAQAMLGDPDLLVLDEPTVGLDPEQRLRFREMISQAGEGRTVVMSSHQTEDITALCTRIAVIHQGRTRFAPPRFGSDRRQIRTAGPECRKRCSPHRR